MWPYTNDEAGWLTPPERPQRTKPGSANDNDPARHVPPRPDSDLDPATARKPNFET
jgi:hypothetical protein